MFLILEFLFTLITTLTLYLFYKYKKNHYFFNKHGIKYVPGVPVFGNTYKGTFQKRHIAEDVDAVYKAFPDERYVGYVEGTTPFIMIRDPEIIKDITIKDFEHFVNHREYVPEEIPSIFRATIFNMKDDVWREMRATLTPAFTSAKMRYMMPFMVDISKNFIDYLKDHQSEDIWVDDVIRRFTNDVIASTAFGIQVNSLVDKDNEFFKAGAQIFSFDFSYMMTLTFIGLFPRFAKIIGLTQFPEKLTRFFYDTVANTIEYRKNNNIVRPDMLHLLLETNKEWTQEEIASQVFMFFIAGYETSASTLTLCIHELALNPDVEEKLYEEIKEFSETKGELLYDNIGELKYLDCVLSEAHRKWSPAIKLDRTCTKPYVLPPPREGGEPFKVPPGFVVYNAVNSIQMDPKYFPDPEKFDPERFSDENKGLIKPYTLLPFGSGPRNCIGIKFALLELKVIMYYLVRNFKIVKCEKTANPITLLPKDYKIKVLGGSWVRFQARE